MIIITTTMAATHTRRHAIAAPSGPMLAPSLRLTLQQAGLVRAARARPLAARRAAARRHRAHLHHLHGPPYHAPQHFSHHQHCDQTILPPPAPSLLSTTDAAGVVALLAVGRLAMAFYFQWRKWAWLAPTPSFTLPNNPTEHHRAPPNPILLTPPPSGSAAAVDLPPPPSRPRTHLALALTLRPHSHP